MFDAKKLLNDVMGQLGDVAGKGLGVPGQGRGQAGDQRSAMMKGMGGGALAGLLTGLLLGTKGGRKAGGSALKLGSLAAVGALAYKAYQGWQAKQQASVPAQPAPAALPDQNRADALSLLSAMIAAAKADGHVDETERAAIMDQAAKMGLEADAQAFLQAELAKPLDAKAIAAQVRTPEAAAEVYALSALVIDESNPAERAYLTQLASALNLSPELALAIESELKAA